MIHYIVDNPFIGSGRNSASRQSVRNSMQECSVNCVKTREIGGKQSFDGVTRRCRWWCGWPDKDC